MKMIYNRNICKVDFASNIKFSFFDFEIFFFNRRIISRIWSMHFCVQFLDRKIKYLDRTQRVDYI